MISIKELIKVSGLIRISIFGLSFVFCQGVLAKENHQISFDIYRTNQISVEEIKKKFGKKITETSRLLEQVVSGKAKEGTDKKIDQNISEIASGIDSMGDFALINIVPIAYAGEGVHITIDIVDKKDKQRMPAYSSLPTKNLPDPDHLIQKWKAYMDKGFKMTFQEKRDYKPISCPAHHCIYGFNESELKPYKNIFNTLVPKNKQKLIQILKEDQDEKKRASVVFLLAHLNNEGEKEILNILSPSMSDPSLLVRNNVMRVFGAILEKGNMDFPIEKVLSGIDSPYLGERNRSLVMISQLLNNKRYTDYVRNKGAKNLIALLKLYQPDQHDPAYEILKKISGKNYSDRDYRSWEQWAKSVQQKP